MADFQISLEILAFSLLCTFAALGLLLRERWRSRRIRAKLVTVSEEMDALSLYDGNTGLLNRHGIETALGHWIARADRDGSSFCAVFLSIDEFTSHNQAFGQEFGDQLIKLSAQRLEALLPEGADLSCFNDGEFVLLLSGNEAVGLATARLLLERFAQALTHDHGTTMLTCSIGVSVYPAHGGRSRLLVNASIAARQVVRQGGGDFCLYDPQMSADLREQTLLVADLRQAIEQGQLELYFQPKVDARTLHITAAEALLRWHHPTRGHVSPAVFIPLAERNGLIGTIGNWVIEEACRVAGHWRELGLRMRVAVNISGYQMRQDDLVERIAEALRRHHLQPGRFTCEITESVAMEDTKGTQLTFEKMRAIGLHVSIDDFGTGYSSLATLRRLPASELKVDRAFVSDLAESEDARSIANSIIGLAKALNLKVVAEGVETQQQCDWLMKMGCDELQGYLFSRPIPAAEMERLAMTAPGERRGPGFSDSLFNATVVAELAEISDLPLSLPHHGQR